MSRQGLHRRRGHKYRSATAIFPAAPAAQQHAAGRAPLRLRLQGRGLVGGLGRELGVVALLCGRLSAVRTASMHRGLGPAA